MLSLQEIIHDPNIKFDSLPKDQQDSLNILLERVNKIRLAWNKSMTVSSGYRTLAEHLRIYKEKGITDQSKIPMKSKHLFGEAVDISDPGLLLTTWLKSNPKILEDANLWCEDGNSNWVHFQMKPFGSYKPGGTRWFKP